MWHWTTVLGIRRNYKGTLVWLWHQAQIIWCRGRGKDPKNSQLWSLKKKKRTEGIELTLHWGSQLAERKHVSPWDSWSKWWKQSPSHEWKWELHHLGGVWIHQPHLTWKHSLTTAHPPEVPCPQLCVPGRSHDMAQMSPNQPSGYPASAWLAPPVTVTEDASLRTKSQTSTRHLAGRRSPRGFEPVRQSPLETDSVDAGKPSPV